MFDNFKVFNLLLIIVTIDVYALQTHIRNRILVKQNNNCGLCNASFSKMIPHEIHRINHNSSDNREHNLMALCCNCHASHHRNNISVKPYFSDYITFSKTPEPYC